jgi:hypothetical protein
MAKTAGKASSRTAAVARRAAESGPEPQPAARLQLLVSLDNAPLPIWRRLLVRSDLAFSRLHDVLQVAMGWEDAHMHEFEVGEQSIGPPQPADPFGDSAPTLDERRTTLAAALAGVHEFRYWYDFGDDWWHTIKVEAVLPLDGDAPAAELLDGAGACPPENCGGPFGYAELLSILSNPRHRERAGLIEHYGEIDPAAFDLELHRKRLRPRASRR